jgi:hypothetical protein
VAENREDQQIHDAVGFVGLRAQATAVGLLQLSIELRRAGVIDEAAITRIKDAIAKDISLSCPRSQPKRVFLENIRLRLDRLFAGRGVVGDASNLGDPENPAQVGDSGDASV